METNYINLSNPDDLIDGPSDEELKQIEEELEKYSDWTKIVEYYVPLYSF